MKLKINNERTGSLRTIKSFSDIKGMAIPGILSLGMIILAGCTKQAVEGKLSNDTTAPTVSSVSPGVSSTTAAVSTSITVTFSESLNSSTVNTSTFMLKQGTVVITGTVTCSGNTATFVPSAALSASTTYSVTVKSTITDAAGNALTADYSWSFTTAAASAAMSFSNDVVPVLALCNNCHTHGWTTSSNASSFYTNLVNGGYVKPTSYSTSKIYTMLNSGHASSISSANRNKILNWMNEGSKNN